MLGHAKNLAEAQPNKVDFVLDTLPIIKNADVIERRVQSYGLFEGTSVETSGGLLIAIPKKHVKGFQ